MATMESGHTARWIGTFAVALLLALGGCSGDDGKDGTAGTAGSPGSDGISCWDLNENGIADPEEDTNGDGVVDVLDCQLPPPSISDPATLHRVYFADRAYEGTESCLDCHGKIADEILTTGHFKWEGVATNLEGVEGGVHGKNDIINNFCVAVPSNEGRCTQCHIGFGYKDANFDFGNPKNIDCFACHDQTGTYKKAPTTAGLPDPSVDLQAVAQSVGDNGGVPTRKACLFCHAGAGGGDNVKHGDLSSDQIATTREYDVHMGVDGANLSCVDCHGVKRDAGGALVSHGIGGMPYHSVDEGDMKQCTDCHGDRNNIHAGTSVQATLQNHERLACQACHIPAFSRKLPTKTEWYWADAGQDISPIPVDPETGKALYDKMKGTFVWAANVRPELLFFDGKWNKTIINVNDRYTSLPAVLAAPATDYTNPAAMIYPFKKLVGNQPADKNNKTILVPHLFGTVGGPNPYWAKYDWDLAIRDGVAAAGQEYTGEYEFVDTLSYWAVNHEIAPKEQALGMGGTQGCVDCHGLGQINWAGLGWSADPALGGTRP
jgi:octaheme c-type cytochrome (tetrathionate reductase family)